MAGTRLAPRPCLPAEEPFANGDHAGRAAPFEGGERQCVAGESPDSHGQPYPASARCRPADGARAFVSGLLARAGFGRAHTPFARSEPRSGRDTHRAHLSSHDDRPAVGIGPTIEQKSRFPLAIRRSIWHCPDQLVAESARLVETDTGRHRLVCVRACGGSPVVGDTPPGLSQQDCLVRPGRGRCLRRDAGPAVCFVLPESGLQALGAVGSPITALSRSTSLERPR
jgi:hypothetical protein